jgi:hypothetical protein
MVRRMVRFFLGGQSEGLAQQRQTHQQEDQQRPPGEPTVASHTDAIVARSDGFRLTEYSGPRGLWARTAPGKGPDLAPGV